MSVKYEQETVSCLGCGSNNYSEYLRAQDLVTFTGEYFNIVKCNDCGYCWTNPRPLPQFIGQFYPESYGPYNLDRGVKVTFGNIANGLTDNWLVSSYHIPIDDYSKKSVLEIGCSSGNFLKKVSEMGAKTQGVEFSDYAAKLARLKGLSVHTGSIDDFSSSDKYDYVFAWMVLEHLYDPREALKKIKEWLRPNGLFVFSVPDKHSLDFWIFGKYWHGLHLPGHMSHFDQEMVRKILEKSGFKVLLMTHQVSSSNYFSSLRNYFNVHGITAFNGVIDALLYNRWTVLIRRVFDVLARLTHQSGRMTVWAQKVD